MRIYPPFKKNVVKLANPNKFYSYLESITETYDGKIKHDARLYGKISNIGFSVTKKHWYGNHLSPIITGNYLIRDNEEILLEVYLEIRNAPIVAFFSLLCLFLLSGIIKGKSLEFAGHIILSASILAYFTGWVLYLIDLKKVKLETENIIEHALS